jgi:predicted RNA binding protein YcfA (HicA-like mRNA interferase family)
MVKLPVISSIQAIRAFELAGWRVARQRGSHTTMTKEGMRSILTIPQKKEMPRGTLRRLIGLAGLSVDEFVECLK